MKKVIVAGSLLAALTLSSPAGAQDKPLTVKQIMVKLNKGPTSLCPVLGKELKASAPNWETVQKETKDFADLAEAMVKTDPPKGEKGSWEKLTKAYAADAKSLDEAAQKKDQKTAQTAQGKLAGSCKSCHTVHRG